ncbi:MAG: hypothetical protein RLZZ01_2209, partial [Actinomycetota bacterium]
LATGVGWRAHWVRACTLAVVALLGVSIRPQAALAVFLVSTPLLAVTARRHVRRVAGFVGVVVAGLATNRLIIRLVIGSEYRSYLAYNEARQSLHGTPRTNAEVMTPEILQRIGWSPVDRGMFAYSVFDDRRIFGFEAVRYVASETASYRQPLAWRFVLDEVVLVYPWLLGSVVLLALAAFLWQRPLVGSVVSCQVAITVVALTWIGLTARLPERVALPVWLAVAVTAGCAGLVQPRSGATSTRTATSLAVGVWAAALVVAVWSGPIGPSATSRYSSARNDALERQLDLLEGAHDDVVIAHAGALASQGTDPLAVSGPFADGRIVSPGWDTFAPFLEDRKAARGVDSALLAILERDDVVWFANESVTAYYQSYLQREVRGDEVITLEAVECIPAPDVCMWRLVRGPIDP